MRSFNTRGLFHFYHNGLARLRSHVCVISNYSFWVARWPLVIVRTTGTLHNASAFTEVAAMISVWVMEGGILYSGHYDRDPCSSLSLPTADERTAKAREEWLLPNCRINSWARTCCTSAHGNTPANCSLTDRQCSTRLPSALPLERCRENKLIHVHTMENLIKKKIKFFFK